MPRDFYSKMNKAEILQNVKISDANVFKIKPDAAITSLLLSLTPFFDSNVKPTESILELKLRKGIYTLLTPKKSSTLFFLILPSFGKPTILKLKMN